MNNLFDDTLEFPGKLIVICGFDGSGKSTQVKALTDYFIRKNQSVLVTRQPTDWYRQLPLVRKFMQDGASPAEVRSMALLAAADRLQHVHQEILPALKEGAVVICDRYIFASIVLFKARGLDEDFITHINAGIIRPSHTFYLKVPEEIISRRLRERDGNNLKFEERQQRTINDILLGYESLAGQLTMVDGTLPAERVTESIIKHIDNV